MDKENLYSILKYLIDTFSFLIETVIKYVIPGNAEIDNLKYIATSNLLKLCNINLNNENISLIVNIFNSFQLGLLISIIITIIIKILYHLIEKTSNKC